LKFNLENITFLCEKEKYSKEELIISFNYTNIDKIIISLIESKYLESNSKLHYCFNYVGIISIDNNLVCVFPKYFNDKDLNGHLKEEFFKEFKQIIKVLKKYSKHHETPIGNFDFEIKDLFNSELLLADEIIKDYVEFGIYTKESSQLVPDGEGLINWDATLNSIDPVFSKRSPLYYQFLSDNNCIEEEYVITQLHRFVVNYCINNYAYILDYNLTSDLDPLENIYEIGDEFFLKNLITRELKETFIDRNIRLLRMLNSFIDKKYNQRKGSDLVLYGTLAYYAVWEKTCSYTFNNKLSYKFIENIITNLSVSDKIKFDGKTFKEIIPQPLWKEIDSGKEKEVKGTLIPDIVSIINHLHQSEIDKTKIKAFFVLDPKYYDMVMELNDEGDLSVKQNPGIGDITKQILYEHIFKDNFKSYYDTLYNILLFPKPDLKDDMCNDIFFKVLGKVTFSLEIFKNNIVWLVGIDPKAVYSSYLKNDFFGEKELINIAKTIDLY